MMLRLQQKVVDIIFSDFLLCRSVIVT